MPDANRFVIDGRDLNQLARRLAILLIAWGVVCAIGMLLLNLDWFLTYSPSMVAVAALSPATFLLFSAIGAHGLNRHSRIIVLRDGLEIGGRFVHYDTISEVHLEKSTLAAMTYTFHGVEMTAHFGRPGFSNAGTLRVMAELRNRVGLRVGAATRAAATQ